MDHINKKSESVHPEEDELMKAGCDVVDWAIPELEELIDRRKKQYKESGGGDTRRNPRGPGHKDRIDILENI